MTLDLVRTGGNYLVVKPTRIVAYHNTFNNLLTKLDQKNRCITEYQDLAFLSQHDEDLLQVVGVDAGVPGCIMFMKPLQ